MTENMMSWLINKAAEEGPNSATTAIVDWILISLYTGFWASKWSQKTQGAFDRVKDWPRKPARAMTHSDFTFMDDHERPLHGSDLSEHMIKYLMVRWQIQKNLQNGQKVTFAGDRNNPAYCATSAALRVYRHSVCLGMKAHESMGVFLIACGKTRFITDALVNTLLWEAARITLGLKNNDPELLLWSTHSIRVMAANLLYRQQLSDQYIQKCLHWPSSAFLVYLRNTIHSAEAH